jgi:hypothetical protein
LRYLTRLDSYLNRDNADSVRSHLTPLRQREVRALLQYLGTLKLLRIVPTHAGAVDKLIEFELRSFRSLVAVEIRGVKLGLVGDWRRLAKQLRLVIVHDCLNSLDELLDVGTVVSSTTVAGTVAPSDANDVDDNNSNSSLSTDEPWGQLQQLSCAENFIPRMDVSLHALTRLERLDLSHNLIARIENTEHCYNLSYLNLGHNRIEAVNAINLVLGNVSVLILRDNMLSSMLGLEKLFNLRRLDLTNNRLADLTELRDLGSLPVLEQLWLARNPLTAAPSYRSAVFFAFQQDNLVLDGRSPTDSERRERSEERVLRAAARDRASSNPEAPRSAPVVVTRRKLAHRTSRKPAIAPVLAAATAPASGGIASSLESDEAAGGGDEPAAANSGAPSSETSPTGSRRPSTLAFDISLESLDRLATSPSQPNAAAYLQDLRRQGGAAWLLMMEELSSGDVPDTPAARGALLTRLNAKTNTGSLSRIIAPKFDPAALKAPAAVTTTSTEHLAPSHTASAPTSPRDSDTGSASGSASPTLSRYASMPPVRARSTADAPPPVTNTAAPAPPTASVPQSAPLPSVASIAGALVMPPKQVAVAPPAVVVAPAAVVRGKTPSVSLSELASMAPAADDVSADGGGPMFLGMPQAPDDVLQKALVALLRKDGDTGELRVVLRTNGLVGKSDDEQRLFVVLTTTDSFCVTRGEPPTLHARLPLTALVRLTVALGHQYCVLRCASGETFTLLFRDPTLAARWLKQLALASARVQHTIDGDSSAADTATMLQREVLGDVVASDPVKLYSLVYRVVAGAKRYTGFLPEIVHDDGVQPTTLVVSRQWLALCSDGFGGVGPFGDVIRFEVSDVASLVLDQHSHGFTIVFDEQAEPSPKKDKRAWRRTNNTHRWTLVTQSPAERDKIVGVIAKLWKAIFKIDLVQM